MKIEPGNRGLCLGWVMRAPEEEPGSSEQGSCAARSSQVQTGTGTGTRVAHRTGAVDQESKGIRKKADGRPVQTMTLTALP